MKDLEDEIRSKRPDSPAIEPAKKPISQMTEQEIQDRTRRLKKEQADIEEEEHIAKQALKVKDVMTPKTLSTKIKSIFNLLY